MLISRSIAAGAALLLGLVAGAAEARRQIVVVEDAAVVVLDGDTIRVGGEPVRLQGVHAPELHEPGGRAARRWMVENTSGRRIICRLSGARSHGRHVGVCRNEAGDLAAQLIVAGLGRDCPRYSSGRYAAHETPAGRALTLPAYCRPR